MRISRLVYCNQVIKIGMAANAPYTILVLLNIAIKYTDSICSNLNSVPINMPGIKPYMKRTCVFGKATYIHVKNTQLIRN